MQKLRHRTVVREGACVLALGRMLSFSGEAPPRGAEVLVWVDADGRIFAALAEEVSRQESRERSLREASALEVCRQLDAARDRAREINARLQLPFAWDVGKRDTEQSLRVSHIVVLEAYGKGRLVRECGDFLCTSASRSSYGRGVWVPARALDGRCMPYPVAVTCGACLRLARRWIRPLPEEFLVD